MTTAPGIGCVDGHDIEISRELKMLEAIVQYKTVGRKMIYCTFSCGEPIRITDDGGNSNKIACQKIRLVSGFSRIRKDRESVRY